MDGEEGRTFIAKKGSAEEVETLRTDTSYVKITRNSRGYNWDIKVVDQDPDKAMAKVKELDKEASEKWGPENV